MRDGERHAQVAAVLPLPARPRVRPEPKQCGGRERCQEKGHGRARGQAHRAGGGLARIRRDRNRGHHCRKDCDRSDTDERPAVQQPRGSVLLHVGPPPAFSDHNSGTCTVAMHCSPATARNWPIIYGRTGRCRLDSLTGRGGTGFASSYLARTRAEGGANGQDERQWQVGRLRSGSAPAAGSGRRQRAVASGRDRGRSGVEAAADELRVPRLQHALLVPGPAAEAREDPDLRRRARRHRAARLLLRRRARDRTLSDRAHLTGRGHAGERGAAHDVTTRGTSWSRACAASDSRAPRICNASRRCGRRSRSHAAAR